MKEKLTLNDLVDLLSKKTSLSKKESDAFLREFFSLITENVFHDEAVKIKDFGTFKLTRVNSRESVDVNTGEKIEIPAHYKLSFLPDKSLKDLVNKPYSHFETTLLEEGVSFDLPEETNENAELSEIEDTADDIQEIEVVQEEIQIEYTESPVSAENPEPTEVVEEAPELEEENSFVEETEEQEISEPVEVQPEIAEETEAPIQIEEIKEKSSQKPEEKEAAMQEEEINSPFSYVYTSTVSAEGAGSNPAITFVAPETDKAENKNVEDTPQPAIGDEEENPLATPIELNKVQEKIDELKEELKAFRKDCLSSTAKIVQEEKKVQEQIYEDVTREIKEAAGDDDLDMLKKLQPVEQAKPVYKETPVVEKQATVKEPVLVEIDEEKEEDAPEKETIKPVKKYRHSYFWKRMFRYIAFIVVLVAILVFGVYKIFKLYENSPERLAENNSDLSALNTLVDTSDNDDEAINDSAVFFQKEPMGKIISDRLKICVVKKGEHQLQTVNQEQPQDVEVYEVVKPGSFLRSISVKHYGKNIFWVYIYEENKDKIADPNNVDIGTVLRIPDLKKYGTSVDDPEAMAKAIKVETEIMNSAKPKPRRR